MRQRTAWAAALAALALARAAVPRRPPSAATRNAVARRGLLRAAPALALAPAHVRAMWQLWTPADMWSFVEKAPAGDAAAVRAAGA